jgi:hypothetical protein
MGLEKKLKYLSSFPVIKKIIYKKQGRIYKKLDKIV